MRLINKHLNLKQIAESGQTFRWYEHKGDYVVVANHKAVRMRQLSDGIEIEDEDDFWYDYFDMKRDYGKIISYYKGRDAFLDEAMEAGGGIRILRQDAFEIIVSFIISANNNIKRITDAMRKLSEGYGDFIASIDGIDYYDFPRPDQLKDVTIEAYRSCGLGYRDKFLVSLIKDIQEGFDPYDIKKLEDSELKEVLLRLKGVGEKVANCIILFAYSRTDGFPIDTWIKKILISQYNVMKDQKTFVSDFFDYHGGIAQQYLFYYGRNIRKL